MEATWVGVSDIYEKVLDHPKPLISIINTMLEKLRKTEYFKKENTQYFEVKDSKFTRT